MGTVADVTARVNVLLNEAGVANSARHWDDAELFLWVTDGQREIGRIIPSALSDTDEITLVSGAKQRIPNNWDLLLNIYRNSDGTAISRVNRDKIRKRTRLLTLQEGQLQAIPPDWERLIALQSNISGADIKRAYVTESGVTPRAFSEEYIFTEGCIQKLPIYALNLHGVISSAGMCLNIEKRLLDAYSPNWINARPSAAKPPVEWFYAPELDERAFFVHPPALNGQVGRIFGSLIPTSIHSSKEESDVVEEYRYAPDEDPSIFWVIPPVKKDVQIYATGVLIEDAWFAEAGNTSTSVDEWAYHSEWDMAVFYVNPGVKAGVVIEAVGRKIVSKVTALSNVLSIPDRYIGHLALYTAARGMQKQSDYSLNSIGVAFISEFKNAIQPGSTTIQGNTT